MSLAPASGMSSVVPALVKLIEAVEEENGALQHLHLISHVGFTDRKNQALRELMAAQRREAFASTAVELHPMLQRLSEVLKRNSTLLKHHITAVGEVSDIIVAGLRDADSDGTYSRDRGAHARR